MFTQGTTRSTCVAALLLFAHNRSQTKIAQMLQIDATTEDLIEVLTHRVPLLTLHQIAKAWFANSTDPSAAAMSTLLGLETQGLIFASSLAARPELDLKEPVFVWAPGNHAPHCGPIAYQLKNRWKAAAIRQPVVIATRLAKRLFGGYLGGKLPRRSEVTHNIHLAQVYLRVREEQPTAAEQWISEYQLYAEGHRDCERLPDGTIRDPQTGMPRLFIEFGGSYSKQKIEAFHHACQTTPYQIW